MNKRLIFFKIYCIKKMIIYNSNRNNKALKNKSGKSLDWAGEGAQAEVQFRLGQGLGSGPKQPGKALGAGLK